MNSIVIIPFTNHANLSFTALNLHRLNLVCRATKHEPAHEAAPTVGMHYWTLWPQIALTYSDKTLQSNHIMQPPSYKGHGVVDGPQMAVLTSFIFLAHIRTAVYVLHSKIYRQMQTHCAAKCLSCEAISEFEASE